MSVTENAVDVAELVGRSQAAYRVWSRSTRAERAGALTAIADDLDAGADMLVSSAMSETHLAQGRLRGELKRTTFQLRLFADLLLEGGYLDARVDHADPEWPMGPRPDLRRTSQAIGPVVVYAASNFPFAFSVAGGDTCAALAAGASVIVKAHEGHPELSRQTANVVIGALQRVGAPDHVFSMVETREDGIAVLQDPRVKAGAFTGSIPGGRALFDIAVSRPEPIPFYGELGSVNPTFVTKEAAATRAREIADGFRGSFTMGSGQFCTKPGVVVLPEDSELLRELQQADLPEGQPMLNERLRQGHSQVLSELQSHPAVTVVAQGADPHGEEPSPTLLSASAQDLRANMEDLFRECFGPTALLVTYRDEEELLQVAELIDGQLTATVVAQEEDSVVPRLVDELREKAGRLLWNEWPTGVTVSHAQQHGGPYPATTAPGTTSVGTAAIARFLRPVALQGFPSPFLPDELTEEPQEPLVRRIDGRSTPTSRDV